MPQIARALKDEFPQLVLELILSEVPRDAEDPQPDLDLFVESPEHQRPVPQGYRRKPLVDDPYVVVVSREHPFAARSSVSLAELAAEALVDSHVTGGLCHRVLMSACSAAGFIPSFAVQAQDHYTAIAFAARGVGITVVPLLCTQDLPANAAAIALTDPEPVRSISLLVRESVADSPVVASAARLIAEFANEVSGAAV